MATLCCDAIAEGLRTVMVTSLPDLREGFNMQRNILHMVLKLHHRITTGLVTTNGPALGLSLGPPALEVVMAGFDATIRLQEAVLRPDALSSGRGEHLLAFRLLLLLHCLSLVSICTTVSCCHKLSQYCKSYLDETLVTRGCL